MNPTPNIRLECRGFFPQRDGKVWLRDPADSERWIDISHYVYGFNFKAPSDSSTTVTITFHKAVTGAPEQADAR